MKIADEILTQLGGSRFVAMTGSSHFVSDKNKLRMSLTKNMSKANRLEITLNDCDLYDMRFYKYTAPRFNRKTVSFSEEKVIEVASYKDIYCDMLQEIFTKVTGMYTRL